MTTETKTAEVKAVPEFKLTPDQEAGVALYSSNSSKNSKGILVVSKKPLFDRLESAHGVSQDDVKKVMDAIDAETELAAVLALRDLEQTIGAATPEQLADDEWRRSQVGAVRLPTYGGSTLVRVKAEKYGVNPSKLGAEGDPTFSTTYGRTSVGIETSKKMSPSFHAYASSTIKNMFNVTD
jgi:hypothetical protein